MSADSLKRFAIIKDGLGWLIERHPPRWGSPIGALLYTDQQTAESDARALGGQTRIVLLKGEET